MTTEPRFRAVSAERRAELAARLDVVFDTSVADLADLARIRSVSYAPDNQETLAASSRRVVELLEATGVAFDSLEIVRTDAAERPGLPAVLARKAAPVGRPTVLLYAHQDVQPVGDGAGWLSDPWEPTEHDGRLYGRGVADDKSGVLAHVTALGLLGDELGVGIALFIDGEEEDGSWSFSALLDEHRETLAADALIVADSFNWGIDEPGLVTALRGTTTLVVEVETLDHGIHSGQFGGPIPDAVGVLVRMLASVYDENGGIAVTGLDEGDIGIDLDYPEEMLRADSGLLPDLGLAGDGSIASRLWAKPSITIIGIDAPSIATSSNTLQPTARARLSMRSHPGQDPVEAGAALRAHLEARAPHGARVTFVEEHHSAPYIVDAENAFVEASRTALEAGFGHEAVLMGVGGSVPFITDAVAANPGMAVLLTGMSDFDARPHSANEGLHLRGWKKAILAEAIFLDMLAEGASE